jgi:Tannase and feruloyl esterase
MRFMGGCEQTETFLRLFLIPGVHHGRGGPGLTEFDALTALEKWVERGPPPKLIACHRNNGVIERCRPVFPYPMLAKDQFQHAIAATSCSAADASGRR